MVLFVTVLLQIERCGTNVAFLEKIQKTSYFFENPIDQNRNISIFSDAPHLIKCIRYRLLKVICKA